MINTNDFNAIKQRYEATWRRENHDRALISLVSYGHKGEYTELPPARDLADAWENAERAVINARNGFNSTHYYAEGFPCFCPNFGPDFFGAILGATIEYGDRGTSWAKHISSTASGAGVLSFDPNNEYFTKMLKMTEAAVNDANGDYIVAQTDIHTNLDALTSLIGAQETCLDLYDDPDSVISRLNEAHEVFGKYFSIMEKTLASRGQVGTSNWTGIFSEKRFYVTSCDAICLISPDAFDEFFFPILKKELAFLGRSIFHLDGFGALRHLDKLLELPELDGIQWVPGEGKPSAIHNLDILHKIQDAGKCLQIICTPAEIPEIAANLRPEGLFLSCGCGGEKEANEILSTLSSANCR